MKSAVKEKEDALNKERAEFMNMISELTNVIKIQKRRICEVTGLCNNQQRILHEKDEELSRKVRRRISANELQSYIDLPCVHRVQNYRKCRGCCSRVIVPVKK